MHHLLPLLVAIPLLGAALLVATGRRLPRIAAEVTGFVVSGGTAALALVLLLNSSPPMVEWVGGWLPLGGESVGIVVVGDGPSLGMAALVSLLTLAALAYSWRYFDEPPRGHPGAFTALMLLFQGGMCGFAIAGDLFNAFVFFELMSVTAYALTGYRIDDPKAVQGALTFGVVNSLGAYAMLTGIALLYARTGQLAMAKIGRGLDAAAGHGGADALVLASFVLVLTGLLVKAAAVPFHFWLPDAHAVAPTPVCMLLSGVMVELGVYGVWRVYGTVFAGPGGIPAADLTRALVTLGTLTAATGAVMCWYQRHIKRLLAYSTISHTGLFLVGLGILTPQGDDGAALYILGHAGVKAALFACAGVLLDRYGCLDEHTLYGRARELRATAVMFAVGGLGLAGLPPFGTGLGKAVTEEAVGGPLTVVYVVASAITGGAVLRVTARVFRGLGPRPEEADADLETSGSEEEPETTGPLSRIPDTMTTVPAVLLAAALAVGAVPGFGDLVARSVNEAGSGGAHASAQWTAHGVLLDLLSTGLAVGLAGLAVTRPHWTAAPDWSRPLRRLQSGHVGDYVAWLLMGATVLGALALPAVLGG
ncbi:multisubunit sodium/proton antiporter MrpD subunit [Streptomyces puniciscabiei]|uniref:Multisubunit sodium/proton antiporter MrpD subunit n=1 Tax=Streptomyces puniciscabiei TaxID=164348 RepID=A0A542SXY4_9ACTN|nr:complex I subunit 5 family protein [Streptomyces puniciscabiei]TQK79455.1 multisubunit sodium/proton antiporter MrpD subunit [Streptomyces puniciscabiei]